MILILMLKLNVAVWYHVIQSEKNQGFPNDYETDYTTHLL